MEEVERFEAEGADGRRYTVVLWATLVPFTASTGVTTYHRGSTELRLAGGGHVNDNRDGTYEIFDTDEIIRRVEG